MRPPARKRQRGLALITAMLVVAVVTTAAAYLSFGQQVWLRQAQNLRDATQAQWVERGALDLIGYMLTKDGKDSATDHLDEQWAKQLPLFPVEDGAVTARISDAQGRFNLNNLVGKDGASVKDMRVFQRILQAQGLDPGLADALIDWLDADKEVRPTGAEDVEYLTATVPYRAANQALQSVDELRLVKGYTPEVLQKLRPLVTALPVYTEVNVNTAPDVVLSALFPALPLATAKDVAARRPFNTLADMNRLLPPEQQQPEIACGVKTAYFEVVVESRFGRLHGQSRALIRRQPDNKPAVVLWQGRCFGQSCRMGGDEKST